MRLEVRERREDWRESSAELRGMGERGRGCGWGCGWVVLWGRAVEGAVGKERERSEVGVESSMAAVVLVVEGVWLVVVVVVCCCCCCISCSWSCCWRIICRSRFYGVGVRG